MDDIKVLPFDKSKIIRVYEREETTIPEPNLTVVEEHKKFCPHNHLNIFKHHRQIFCKDCGAKLEAFEVLIHFTTEENYTLNQISWLEYELKQKQEEKEKLQREITNLKAQKRKYL